MYETILVEKQENVFSLTLNRPQALNAMDMVMREEIKEVLAQIVRDDEVRVVVLRANGRAFCAGGDIKTMGTSAPNAGRKRLRNVHILYKTLMTMDKPVIAAVNGYAAGSGLALACACDFRIAAKSSKFAASFINVGLVPDCGIFYNLPRLIGVAKAKEMTMLGQAFDAEKALEMGLVTNVVEDDQLDTAVNELASQLAARSPIALALNKSVMNRSFELSLDDALEYEAYAQDVCMMSQEHKELVAAFLDKKKK
ncbi:MAG TPA: enoyl-CoA hydratase/isomerase family protein [Negativicutes bacterium]|nr:enoyl-CoA hydratase/isomerase family protein [Negativicutes bacterium]